MREERKETRMMQMETAILGIVLNRNTPEDLIEKIGKLELINIPET